MQINGRILFPQVRQVCYRYQLTGNSAARQVAPRRILPPTGPSAGTQTMHRPRQSGLDCLGRWHNGGMTDSNSTAINVIEVTSFIVRTRIVHYLQMSNINYGAITCAIYRQEQHGMLVATADYQASPS